MDEKYSKKLRFCITCHANGIIKIIKISPTQIIKILEKNAGKGKTGAKYHRSSMYLTVDS